MKLNFKFEWWKLIFIGLEMLVLIFALLSCGIIFTFCGYLFVGFLICLVGDFVLPRVIITWAIELWKEDIYQPFIIKQ